MYRVKIILFAIIITPLVGILLLLHFLLPSVAEQYTLSSYGKDAYRFSSSHFILITRKNPDLGNRTLAFLEEFYDAFIYSYGETMGLKGIDEENKGYIYLFWDRDSFDNYYEKEFIRDLPNNSAYYNPRKGEIALYLISGETENILRHEVTHLIMNKAGPSRYSQWSRWFDEGISVYFENTRVEGKRLIPQPIREKTLRYVKNLISSGSFISLARLFTSTDNDYVSKGNTVYYDASYLLVYYLIHGENGQFVKKFYEYYRAEQKPGPCHYSILTSILGMDIENLEQRWIAFIQSQN